MTEELCLRWNNHSIAFIKQLNSIFLKDVYSDATIFCHGKFYPVHRFVLSTCSEYFEEVFHECDHLYNKHPFIIVKDIHPEQMEALLNYMYKGEVNVPQLVLAELIKAAESLRIKGLTVLDEVPSPKIRKRSNKTDSFGNANRSTESVSANNSDATSTFTNQLFQSCSPTANDVPTNINFAEPAIDIKEERVIIKEEPSDNKELASNTDEEGDCAMKSAKDDSEAIISSYDFDPSSGTFDEGQETTSRAISQVLECVNEDGSLQTGLLIGQPTVDHGKRRILFCEFDNCFFKSSKPCDIKRHVLTHTGEKPFKCLHCSYKASRKFQLKRHVLTHTGEKPLKCPHCLYRANVKCHLKRHMLIHNRNN